MHLPIFTILSQHFCPVKSVLFCFLTPVCFQSHDLSYQVGGQKSHLEVARTVNFERADFTRLGVDGAGKMCQAFELRLVH